MVGALAATLVIELGVVLVWIAFTQQHALAGRLLLVALAGNLITVPAVWTASLLAKVYLDLAPATLIYGLAEVGAFLFEGSLYARFGRLAVWSAFLLSLTANSASFLCGCCLVSFY
jgi:hypothetical protein